MLTSVEICAGAGGQALGLEQAGFHHLACVELEEEYCAALRINRPKWNVICEDVRNFSGKAYKGVDLLAGGVPCPPFSIAGKQLGENDERDLFPQAIRLIHEINPKAVMIENVKGLLSPTFDGYRERILNSIEEAGYKTYIQLMNASDYGVPQLRPRVIIIGIRNDIKRHFMYPPTRPFEAPSVGQVLEKEMGSAGWEGAHDWALKANGIAPTLVGGSKKHGGPDLGPVRARRAWEALGVNGLGVGNEPPAPGFSGMPKLTPKMMALIQGFPEGWFFGTKKTAACRMIGNAFPPPVAKAVGTQIKKCLEAKEKECL